MDSPLAPDGRSRRTIAALRALLAAAVIVPALLFTAAAWQSRSQVLAAAAETVETTAAMLQERTLDMLEAHEALRLSGRGIERAVDRSDSVRAVIARLDSTLKEMRTVWTPMSGHTVLLLGADGLVLARHPRMETTSRIDTEFAATVRTQPGGGVFWATAQPDEVPRLVAYRQLGSYPVYVGFGLPADVVLQGWWHNVLLYGAVAFPAALGLLWAAWIALERSRQEAAATATLAAEMKRREAAEASLLQRQRMEAVGQLTGGIAHDFNNLLTVICGNLERLQGAALDARQRQMAGAAERAARRAAGLAQQLLAFSRRQTLRPEDFYLQDRIDGTLELLERALPATIDLAVDIGPGIWPIHADWAQLELALLNVAVNARDAMPGGGRLLLSARNVSDAAAAGLDGDFVALALDDTGCGMPEAVKARVFEPFFTTKEVGKGTGLGLSQVFGFTTQSGGTTTIASAPGRGTRVTLFLPRAEQAPRPEPAPDGGVVRRDRKPDERALMAAAKSTQDHDFIRQWVEERGGKPSHVKTVAKGDDVGILRIDFPSPPDPDDEKDGNLEEISWDDFFAKFDENDLVFLYQEETAKGQKSNFNKIVKRETVEATGKGGSKKK